MSDIAALIHQAAHPNTIFQVPVSANLRFYSSKETLNTRQSNINQFRLPTDPDSRIYTGLFFVRYKVDGNTKIIEPDKKICNRKTYNGSLIQWNSVSELWATSTSSITINRFPENQSDQGNPLVSVQIRGDSMTDAIRKQSNSAYREWERLSRILRSAGSQNLRLE